MEFNPHVYNPYQQPEPVVGYQWTPRATQLLVEGFRRLGTSNWVNVCQFIIQNSHLFQIETRNLNALECYKQYEWLHSATLTARFAPFPTPFPQFVFTPQIHVHLPSAPTHPIQPMPQAPVPAQTLPASPVDSSSPAQANCEKKRKITKASETDQPTLLNWKKRYVWSAQNTELLRKAILIFGRFKIEQITAYMQERIKDNPPNKIHCKNKMHVIYHRVKSTPWTQDEDRLLLDEIQKFEHKEINFYDLVTHHFWNKKSVSDIRRHYIELKINRAKRGKIAYILNPVEEPATSTQKNT